MRAIKNLFSNLAKRAKKEIKWHLVFSEKKKLLKKIRQSGKFDAQTIDRLCQYLGQRKRYLYTEKARKERAKNTLLYIKKYSEIKNRTFLDVGCGPGLETVMAIKFQAKKSFGIDPFPDKKIYQAARGMKNRILIIRAICEELPFSNNTFDIVHTNSIEHFKNPSKALQEMKRVTKIGGKIFLLIGGFYHSPTGSHLYNIINIPWSHLLFDEKTLLKYIKNHAPRVEATHYIKQYKELAGLDADDYKKMIFASRGFKIIYYNELKNNDILHIKFYHAFKKYLKKYTKRQLFVTGIRCIMKKEY